MKKTTKGEDEEFEIGLARLGKAKRQNLKRRAHRY
jgi:hypothetical protein